MTDAQLLLFIERLVAGEVHPDEFKAFTVDDARHLYLLRQRRARLEARREDAGPPCRDASSADPGPGRGYSSPNSAKISCSE